MDPRVVMKKTKFRSNKLKTNLTFSGAMLCVCGNLGALRIPREDWGTLQTIRED